MTMPDERMRAVRWGGELLGQVSTDTSLPEDVIAAAKRIALTYPTAQALEDRLQSGAAGMPPGWTVALLDALELFDEMKVSALGSDKTRSDLRYTLRHFPDVGTIFAMSRSSSLGECLQPHARASK